MVQVLWENSKPVKVALASLLFGNRWPGHYPAHPLPPNSKTERCPIWGLFLDSQPESVISQDWAGKQFRL